VGKGTKVWHHVHVREHALVGRDCILGQNAYIDHYVRIGNNVKIQNNVSVYEGVTLEDDVFCGPSMVFTNVINPRSHISRKNEFKKTLVKKGATIGANATIVCGHTIGQYAFVGAGSVVTKDVPDHAMVIGNPARVVGWVCDCGARIEFSEDKPTCTQCGKEHYKEMTGILPGNSPVSAIKSGSTPLSRCSNNAQISG
jgi:UDP-2-acetamido-3-amino-2,3-dideoxy-glucuronate N-acetyltransferase